MQPERILTGRFTAPDGERSDGPHYRIFVRDLDLECLIGAHDFEKDAPQRVRINLDMAVRELPGGAQDKLQNVLCYEAVIAGIKALVSDGHINLIETLAERIAGLCLEDRRATRVTVRVEKLDVDPAAAGVGVEIERRRRQEPPVEVA